MSENEYQESQQLIESCPGCGALLDVSDQEPFALVHCPSCGTKMNARTQFRNFKLLALLGQGGMGRVFKAADLNLHRNVALKILRKEFSANAEDVGRLEREARLTASVNHPNVIKIFSFGSDHGQFFLAMELADKGSLDDLMGLQGMVAELQVLEIGIQIASGLEAAWNVGLIHRDVKPGNILFADAHAAKIVDFGLALLMDEEAAQRGEIWGTPYYIAPEKLDNRPEDFRSDMYSLGATLFHAVAGRPPYEANTASMVALKHLKSMPVSLQAFAPHVAGETTYVINRMLHKDPDKRYQSYAELIEHLEYAKEKVASKLGRPATARERPVVESEESVTLMGWVSLVLLLLVIGGIVSLVMHWSKVTKTEPPPGPVAEQVDVRRPETREERTARIEADYKTARSLIAAGDFEPAYNSFGTIAAESLSAGFRNWCRANESLAAFLTGRPSEGDSLIQEHLQNPKPYGKKNEPGLDVLAEIGRIASATPPIAISAAAGLDPSGPGAFGLLLIGMKNWQAGAFDEGQAYLEAFSKSNPQGEFSWIGSYKGIVKPFLDDYNLLAQARQIAASAGASRDDRARALRRVRDLKAKIVSGPEILGEFEKLENQLRGEASATKPPARQTALATSAAAPGNPAIASSLREAEAAIKAAGDRMEFQPVADRFRAIAASAGAAGGPALAGRVKSATWLAEFLPELSRRIEAGADSGEIRKRDGTLLGDRISAIVPGGLKISSRYGTVQVKWPEIDRSQIIAAACRIARATPGEEGARLLWLTGVFAFEMGDQSLGRDLLVEAAGLSEKFKEELPIYFDVAQARP